jgi:hypothetical protein
MFGVLHYDQPLVVLRRVQLEHARLREAKTGEGVRWRALLLL